jgi:hypothetical protein
MNGHMDLLEPAIPYYNEHPSWGYLAIKLGRKEALRRAIKSSRLDLSEIVGDMNMFHRL